MRGEVGRAAIYGIFNRDGKCFYAGFSSDWWDPTKEIEV